MRGGHCEAFFVLSPSSVCRCVRPGGLGSNQLRPVVLLCAWDAGQLAAGIFFLSRPALSCCAAAGAAAAGAAAARAAAARAAAAASALCGASGLEHLRPGGFIFPDAVCFCRKMLTKDKKPEEKRPSKATVEVIPPRPDTPKLFKAALKVTEQAGIEGTFAKLKKAYKPSESAAEDPEVRRHRGGGVDESET